jgi:hypothetical protein
MWALASCKDGLNPESVSDHFSGKVAEILITKMLDSGILKEINNRTKAANISIGNPKTQTEISIRLAEIADKLAGRATTKAFNEIWGWNDKGIETILTDINNFCKLLTRRINQSELRGNRPFILGLSACLLEWETER